MLEDILRVDLQRFADGGDGAGAPSGDAPGVTGEAAAPQAQDRATRRAQLRARAEAESQAYYAQQAQGEAAAPQQAAEEPQEQASEEAPARVPFSELISGEYKDDYNAAVQDIVRKRVAQYRGAQETLNSVQPILQMLGERYGVDTSSVSEDVIESLTQQLTNDRELYEAEAVREGIPVDLLMRQKQVEREQRAIDLQRQEDAERAEARAEYASLVQQADALKQAVPNFNLDAEMQNPAFGRMVLRPPRGSGVPLEAAYFAIHHAEIEQMRQQQLMQTAQYAVDQTQAKLASAIASGARRPTENGVSPVATAVTRFDPRNLTPQERRDIRARVRRGERITFD